jgi:hypothetical protein
LVQVQIATPLREHFYSLKGRYVVEKEQATVESLDFTLFPELLCLHSFPNQPVSDSYVVLLSGQLSPGESMPLMSKGIINKDVMLFSSQYIQLII